jgi:hypothetical protein
VSSATFRIEAKSASTQASSTLILTPKKKKRSTVVLFPASNRRLSIKFLFGVSTSLVKLPINTSKFTWLKAKTTF